MGDVKKKKEYYQSHLISFPNTYFYEADPWLHKAPRGPDCPEELLFLIYRRVLYRLGAMLLTVGQANHKAWQA